MSSIILGDVQLLKSEIDRLTAKSFLLQAQVDEVAKERRMFEVCFESVVFLICIWSGLDLHNWIMLWVVLLSI